ncbi:MAG: decaprenyl-phosphate phosphoribosyltransferase [Patescibacteria group bacterium]
MPSSLLALFRTQQWMKNLFVFAPLLFSEHLFNQDAVIRSVIVFFAFCTAASFNYILNDLLDRRSDRQHPKKRHRPLASGAVAVPPALFLAAILLLSGLGIAASLGTDVLIVVSGYILLNLWYSIHLKHLVAVDVITIALGFVLRLLAGTVAIDVAYSPWIFLCGFLLTLLLALSKRRQELRVLFALQQPPERTRRVLQHYKQQTLDRMIAITVTATIITYVFYTLLASTSATLMVLSVPFVILGLLRYLHLLREPKISDDPTDLLLSDRPLLMTLVAWIAAIGLILY